MKIDPFVLSKILIENNIDPKSIAILNDTIMVGFTSDVVVTEIAGIKIINRITASND